MEVCCSAIARAGTKFHRLKPAPLDLSQPQLFSWNDWQQQKWAPVAVSVKSRFSGEKFCRPVRGIVVQKRPASTQFILEIGEFSAAARVLVILSADG